MPKSFTARLKGSTRYLNKYAATVALVVFTLFGVLFLPNFVSEFNMQAIISEYSIIGFLAIGQLFVILTAGIDLAQGAFVALTSVIIAVLMVPVGGVLAVAAAILGVSLLGAISGLLVSRLNLAPFIITLGMIGIARGLAQFASIQPLPITDPTFDSLAKLNVFGVPMYTLLWLAMCVLVFWFLTRKRFGRYIFAVGSNEENSRLSGINVKNVKLFVYIFSAFMTALGSVFWASRVVSGSAVAGNGYEFQAIAAVVVGGGSLFGGEGSVFGTVCAVLLFGVLASILNLIGISPYLQGTLKGLLILAAVVLSVSSSRSSKFVIERNATSE